MAVFSPSRRVQLSLPSASLIAAALTAATAGRAGRAGILRPSGWDSLDGWDSFGADGDDSFRDLDDLVDKAGCDLIGDNGFGRCDCF